MEQEKGAVYCRLSQDDGSAGESGSIQTQRTLLTQYCKEHSIQIVDYYCDDGKNCEVDPDFLRCKACALRHRRAAGADELR